jgi:type IV secretory pathway VirB10-like protein
VDLIAPVGAVDAGDAGIRSSGNLTIAAAQVLNASNIAVSGTSVGTPAPAPSAPAVSPPAPPPPPSSNKPANGEKTPVTDAQKNAVSTELPVSDVTVEVLGYGGSDAPPVDDATNLDDEEKKRRRQKEQEDAERKEQDAKVNSEAPAPGLR